MLPRCTVRACLPGGVLDDGGCVVGDAIGELQDFQRAGGRLDSGYLAADVRHGEGGAVVEVWEVAEIGHGPSLSILVDFVKGG